MKNTYVIKGTIKSVEPLATASKDLIDTAKKLYGANSPVPVPSFDTEDGKHLYFPATGLRGTLRRALRDILRDNLIARGANGLLLDEHYFLTLGGIKGSGADQRSTVKQEEEWRGRNVLLSLFGAGDAGVLNFVTGKASISNAICGSSVRAMTVSGARTDDLFRNREGLSFLADSEVSELIARAEGNSKASAIRKEIGAKEVELSKAKRADNDTTSIQAELVKLNDKLAKTLKDSNASSVSVGMPLAGFQAIPPYTSMDHTIKLFNATPQELGGMLAALNQLSMNPTIGAHKAVGCGEIEAEYEISKVTKQGLVGIALIKIGGFEPMRVKRSGDDFEMAAKAFEAYLASEDFDISVPYAI